MQNKTKIISIIIVLTLVLGILYLYKQNQAPLTNPYTNETSAPLEQLNTNGIDTKPVVTTPPPTNTPTKIAGYTIEDVSKHNHKLDCWTAVNGSVYNVTPWIAEHPGGEAAILSLCGIDGSAAFSGQHGGEKRPANELAGFKIGILN